LRTVPSNRWIFYYRESLGKLASLALFGIGFVLPLSRQRKGLHDYIARTRVVELEPTSGIGQGVALCVVLMAVGIAAYMGGKAASHRVQSRETVEIGLPGWEIVARQFPGVMTIYAFDQQGRVIGQGSGFVLSANGKAVTNFHVLRDAHRAEAKLGDGRLFHVLEVENADEENDLFIFRLGRAFGDRVEWPSDLQPLAVGQSDKIQVGDRVAVISSPKGLANSVTDGVVSAIRDAQGKRLLQITAPISPGSSGGPVFGRDGTVVGIATLQFREGQNINFAVPIEVLSAVDSQPMGLPLATFQDSRRREAERRQFSSVFEEGRRLYAAGDFESALSRFLSAERLNPSEAASFYNAALCYRNLGEPDTAARHYRRYLALAPSNDEDRQSVLDWLLLNGYLPQR
jgi:S1-C subfamily serine protease